MMLQISQRVNVSYTCPVNMYTVSQPSSGCVSYLNNTMPMNVIRIEGAHPGVRGAENKNKLLFAKSWGKN